MSHSSRVPERDYISLLSLLWLYMDRPLTQTIFYNFSKGSPLKRNEFFFFLVLCSLIAAIFFMGNNEPKSSSVCIVASAFPWKVTWETNKDVLKIRSDKKMSNLT